MGEDYDRVPCFYLHGQLVDTDMQEIAVAIEGSSQMPLVPMYALNDVFGTGKMRMELKQIKRNRWRTSLKGNK